MVQDGGLLRGPHAGVLRRQRRRLGRLPRADEKLDYLQWLGVDCIWLLPFFESPLRDGGYDISDFFTIQPDYGTVDDVRDFIEAAHQRGIRVIADLVMNHTSSDHPWFQESRSAPDSPKRDWYVWSDTVHGTKRPGSSSRTPRMPEPPDSTPSLFDDSRRRSGERMASSTMAGKIAKFV